MRLLGRPCRCSVVWNRSLELLHLAVVESFRQISGVAASEQLEELLVRRRSQCPRVRTSGRVSRGGPRARRPMNAIPLFPWRGDW